jgi:hypothetical protein
MHVCMYVCMYVYKYMYMCMSFDIRWQQGNDAPSESREPIQSATLTLPVFYMTRGDKYVGGARPDDAGTQFTCFTSTEVQILTPEESL